MEGQLLAQIDWSGNIFYVHDSQIGTPQKITNPSRTLVWDQIQSRSAKITAPRRTRRRRMALPRPVLQRGKHLNYNNFRDYDRSIGRYIEADPLGLNAGPNIYAYAGQNPTEWRDFFGLDKDQQCFGPPVYNPGFWNVPPNQGNNTCTNYAMDTPGAPPLWVDHSNLTCSSVESAACEMFGLTRPDAAGNCPPGYHKVYLVIAPPDAKITVKVISIGIVRMVVTTAPVAKTRHHSR